jgi:thiamine biosynthesis lipoprotein
VTERPHVFETMGTVVSLLATDAPAAVIADVENVFSRFDDRYSLYKPGSELSRIAGGEITLAGAEPELRDTYAAALEWRSRTGGAFTPHRPDGVIDLNGIVKAQAMADAAAVLADVSDWCLNVGGDVLCSGSEPGGEAWNVGIVDPLDRSAVLFAVTLPGGYAAVATSGISERGDHIWRSHGIGDFVQATVVAGGIVEADVLATAIIAGGEETLGLVLQDFDVHVMAIRADGSMLGSPGMAGILATPR